ncbi:MAG TPA: cytochrome P450 [Solirubrobacterales bacterium]
MASDRFDAWVMERYPPVVRMKVFGVGEVVTLRDPEAIRQLFTASPEAVTSGRINGRVLPVLGRGSVMLLDGESHMRMRKLLLPPFHGDAIRGYEGLIGRIAADEVASWPRGSEFPIHPRMQAIALEVILEVVLGVSAGERRRRLRAVLPKVLEANPIAFLLDGRFPWLASGPIGSLRPWVRARREAEALLREEIAAHRANPGAGDILALLLEVRDEDGGRLGDAELVGQLMTLLLAGHETTASSLAWCFERLLRHPAALARLRAELERGEDGYLDAVIKETMRQRPVVEVVWRELAEPYEVGGHRLPAGTIVVPVIRAVAAEAFEAPGEFRPERFTDGAVTPYSHIPFGGGTRRCLGASFATLEMKTVLRTVLERVDLTAPHPAPEPRNRSRRFTTSPGRGARVVAAAR